MARISTSVDSAAAKETSVSRLGLVVSSELLAIVAETENEVSLGNLC